MNIISQSSRSTIKLDVANLWSLCRKAPGDLKRRMVALIVILFGSAVAELLSIGAVVPLLQSLSEPEETMKNIGDFFNFPIPLSSQEFQLFTVAIFCSLTILAGLVRSVMVTQTASITFAWANHLSLKTFSEVIRQPYAYHIKTNSSDIIGAITKSQMIATSLIMPVIQAFTSAVMILGISIFLIWITSPIIIFVVMTIIVIYSIVVSRMKNRMLINGEIISEAQNQRVRAVSETLGMIRDIIIDKTHDLFINRYASIENNLRKAQRENSITSSMPRIIIETGGMVIIALALLVIIKDQGGIESALPMLGVLALGAQRTLPLAQQVYVGVISLTVNAPMVSDLSKYIGLTFERSEKADTNTDMIGGFNTIKLRDIGYSYDGGPVTIFEDVSLNIERGQKIGVIGPTGSGKSTFIELLAGLLEPTMGSILIDDNLLRGRQLEEWRKLVAFVPQNVYLADTSIAQNIAVGVPVTDINYALLNEVLVKAHLDTFIDSLPGGLGTQVGERGVNLSGGQLQRLGIARALYKQPKLLILDEATSALDVKTEAAVMKAIYELDPDLTIIMSAHRKAVLHGADKIFEVSAGHILDASKVD